jgi:predicted Fe-Mo cluster-binding NifX family protein
MNVAIPMLEDRVSPVFDVARMIVLVELDGGREARRQMVPLRSQDVLRRVGELSQHGVQVLICGAVSRPLEAALSAAGIRVIPQTCGPVEEVLGAFVAGRLDDPVFLMPGCCGRRRHGWGGGGRGQRGSGGGRRGGDQRRPMRG